MSGKAHSPFFTSRMSGRVTNSPYLLRVEHDTTEPKPQPEKFVSAACRHGHCRECNSLRCSHDCHVGGAMR